MNKKGNDFINDEKMAKASEESGKIKDTLKFKNLTIKKLHQRTKEGIETARLQGKQIGLAKGTTLTTKKSISIKEKILKYSKDFQGSLNDSDCIQLLGITRNTFYKYKKELKSI